MKFLHWVVANITLLFAFFVQKAQAYSDGKKVGELEAEKAAAEASAVVQQEAKEVRNEVEALPDDELRKRASTWVRGAKRPRKTE